VLYFLDCEFNGFGGELISIALAGEVREIYLCRPEAELNAMVPHPWVEEHVLPFLALPDARPEIVPLRDFGRTIQAFLSSDPAPEIVADWPEDLSHFMRCLILSPGQMVRIPDLTMRLVNASAYPTDLEAAVQHNALWDARALRHARLR
jgi:hypothetical protein